MNIVTKNGGKKREKKFFPKTHRFRKQTTMEKNRFEKVQKYVFYKHKNIVTKKSEEKIATKIFPKTHEQGIPKMLEKIVSKKCENTFFL